MKSKSRRWWLLVEILAMLAAVVAVLSSGCMTRPAARDFDAGRAVAQPAAFEAPATTHLFAVAPISPPLPAHAARSVDAPVTADELWIIARNSDSPAASDDNSPG